MKILILYQKGITKREREFVEKDIKQFYEKDFVDVHIDEPFIVDFEYKETNQSFLYFYRGKQSEGRNYYSTNMFEQLKGREEYAQYHGVFHIYENTIKLPGTDYVAPLVFGTPLTGTTFFGEIATECRTWNNPVAVHELTHGICNILHWKGFINKAVSDNMDTTVIDGILRSYYKNSTPLALDGNYARTLEKIKPFLQYVAGEDRATLVQRITFLIQELTAKLEKKKEITEPYIYFKLAEKTGSFGTIANLEPEFVHMLDEAREIAGIPFIINSGYRTPEHNKKVGGVSDSSHLKRIAVDIKATDNQQRAKILKGLFSVFSSHIRIGVDFERGFIHVDNDTEKVETFYKY